MAQKRPDAVVYVYSGGLALGSALASRLAVPLFPLDVRYPLSRMMHAHPLTGPLFWPVKELLYRMTRPTPPSHKRKATIPPGITSIILADDRISTFRTMNKCLEMLNYAGIDRTRIQIATQRCGQKSRRLVDFEIQLSST